jgi:hypothetical protein
MANTLERTMNNFDALNDDSAKESLMRPFEAIAIACGVATLVGTFLVSAPLLKGALIGGSLLALIASLLYFCITSTRQTLSRIRTSVPQVSEDTGSFTLH